MIGERKSHLLKDILEDITKNVGNSRKQIFLPKKIPKLGKILRGILENELWILGGYSSSGKTFLALQMALKATRQRIKTAYFSLEMAKEVLALRLWASLANVQPLRIEFGRFEREEVKRVKKAKGKLRDLRLFFADNLYRLSEIEKEIRRLKPQLVVIDYLQNLLPEKGEDEYSKLSSGVIRLQKLAKEIDTAILCCSQVSNVEAKAGPTSRIIGYKGSGGLAAACDIGLWLEREPEYEKEEPPEIVLYCRKNRRGSLFKIPLILTFPNGIYEQG